CSITRCAWLVRPPSRAGEAPRRPRPLRPLARTSVKLAAVRPAALIASTIGPLAWVSHARKRCSVPMNSDSRAAACSMAAARMASRVGTESVERGGFVDQQDRDVILDCVAEPAGVTNQRLGSLLLVLKVTQALRADQHVEQLG